MGIPSSDFCYTLHMSQYSLVVHMLDFTALWTIGAGRTWLQVPFLVLSRCMTVSILFNLYEPLSSSLSWSQHCLSDKVVVRSKATHVERSALTVWCSFTPSLTKKTWIIPLLSSYTHSFPGIFWLF